MIVDSNLAASLQYVDPTYQTSLFVRANIYDLSGGSPVLEGSVNLAQINNGFYSGKYTFTAGKPYLVQKLVYTDGTYTTVDQNYAGGSDDVQCIDLKIANLANLDVAVSTRLASLSYTAPDNAGIAAIKAKTDNLPASPANEVTVAAIKAKTDNLPSDPADNSDILTAISDLSDDVAIVGNDVDAIDMVADDIKAKTDNLPSDPADNSQILAAIAAIPVSPTPPSVSDIVDGVWDEPIASHLSGGSTGEKLNSGSSSGGDTIQFSPPELTGTVEELSSTLESDLDTTGVTPEISGEVE